MSPEINPGSHKYHSSAAIPFELGSNSARRGDALAIGASGAAVTTTGSNGYLGVLATATAADATADDSVTSSVASGDEVAVVLHGVARAKVAGSFDSDGSGTNDPVSAGSKLVDGANGALVNVSDGGATPAPVQAGVDDNAVAITDEDADGFALVHLRM